MGVTRLLLATAVIMAHSGGIFGFKPLGAVAAVQSFYMISGFYMALILTEKYRGPGSYRLFLTNRLLRLYPMYWVVAIASLAVWLIASAAFGKPGPLAAGHDLNWPAHLFVRLTDVFIVGQDLTLFLGVDSDGGLYWTKSFRATPPPYVWQFVLVPPAWSLSIEILFYLIAPFLVRRSTPIIALVMVASLGLRGYIYFGLDLNEDPWIYRFFPTELAFFLAGSLAYRVYRWLLTQRPPRSLALAITAFYLLVTLSYQFLPNPEFLGVFGKLWPFHALTWLVIPWLFLTSQQSRVDRYIGELSYPLYIVHFWVLWVIPTGWRFAGVPSESGWVSLTVWLGAVICAIGLHHLVGVPLERYRQARVRAAAQGKLAESGKG